MKEQIINTFKNDKGFIGKNKFEIIKLEDNICVVEYKIKKDGLNPLGIVHGGLIFSLADSAAGALASLNGKFPLTINSNINYLNKASGNCLKAEAIILKNGKTLGYYKVNVYDEENKIVAVATINMYYTEYK